MSKIIYIERKTVVSNGSGSNKSPKGISTFIVSTFKCSWINFQGVVLEPGTTEGDRGSGRMIYAGTLNLQEHSGTYRTGVFRLSNKRVPSERAILFHEGISVADTEGCLVVAKSWNGSSLVSSPLWTSILTGEIRKAGAKNVKVVITNGKNSSATVGTAPVTVSGNPNFNSRTSRHPKANGRSPNTVTEAGGGGASSNTGTHDNHPAIIAAKYISARVERKSKGKCAQYWRKGYQHAKFSFTQKASAYMYVSEMDKMGFVKITEQSSPQIGDVRIWDKHGKKSDGGGVHGHIETWDGSGWCSDYKSGKGPTAPPNGLYSKNLLTYWRHKDLLNGANVSGISNTSGSINNSDGSLPDGILGQIDVDVTEANKKANEAAKAMVTEPEAALSLIQGLPQLLLKRAQAIEDQQQGKETGWRFDINSETEIEAAVNSITIGSSYIPEMGKIVSPDSDYGKLSSKDLIEKVYPHSRYVNPFYYEMFGKEYHKDMSVRPLYFWPQYSVLDPKFINQFNAGEMYKALYENKYKTGLMGRYVEAYETTDKLEEDSKASENNDDHANPEDMFMMLETRYLKSSRDQEFKDDDNLSLSGVFQEMLENLGLSPLQAKLMSHALTAAIPGLGTIRLAGNVVKGAIGGAVALAEGAAEWVTGDVKSTYTGEFPDAIKSAIGSLQVSQGLGIMKGHDPKLAAFADLVSRHEGTHEAKGSDGYRTYYARAFKLDLTKPHPERVITAGKYSSSAAGRYQALKGTWSSIMGGNVVMSPANQDKFMIQMIKDRKAYDLILAGDWHKVWNHFATKHPKAWTSIPTKIDAKVSAQHTPLTGRQWIEAATILQKFYEGAKVGSEVTIEGANVVERVGKAVSNLVTISPATPERTTGETTYTERGTGLSPTRVRPKAGTQGYKRGVGSVTRQQYEQLSGIRTFTAGTGNNTVKTVNVLDAGLLDITVRVPGEVTFRAVVEGANLPKLGTYTGHSQDEYKAPEAKDYAEDWLEGTSWFFSDKNDFKLTVRGYDSTLGVIKVSIAKKQSDGTFLFYSSHMLAKGFAIPDNTTNDNGRALSERARQAKAGMWADPSKIYLTTAQEIASKTQGPSTATPPEKIGDFAARDSMGEIFEDKVKRKPTSKYPTPVNYTDNTRTGKWSTTISFANDSNPGVKASDAGDKQIGIKVITPLPGKLRIQKTTTPGGIVATVTTDVKDLVFKFYNLHEKSLEIVPEGQEKKVNANDVVGVIKGPGRVPELPFESLFREVPFNPLCAKDFSLWPVKDPFRLGDYLNKDGFKSTTNPRALVSDYDWVKVHTDGGIVTVGNGNGIDSIEGGRAGGDSLSEAQQKTYEELRGHTYDKVRDPDGEGPLRDGASVFSNTLVYSNILRNFLKPFEYGNSHMVPQVKGYVVFGNEDDDYYSEGVSLREPLIYELPAIQSFSLACNNDYNPVDVARFTVINPSHMISTPMYYDYNKHADVKQAHTQFYAPSFMEKARIKAGTRVSFKIGYTNNPNFNPTVFNGVIKEVGGAKDYLLECIAEGFGAELLNSEYGSEKPVNFTNGHNASTGSIFGLSLLDDAITHFGARIGRWRAAMDYIGSILRGQHVDEFASGAEWQNDTIFEGKGRIGDMRDPENKALVAPWSWGDNIFNLWFPTRANLAHRVYMNIYSDVIESVHDDFSTTLSLWLNLLSWDKAGTWKYFAYKATPWAIMKEMEYRHPGTLAKPLIYDERMTMFYGAPFQNYIAKDLKPHFMMSAALSNRFENLNNPYTETYLKARTARMQPSMNYHLLHSDFNIISNRLTLSRDFYTRVNVLEYNRTFDGHEPNSSSDVITMTLDDNLASHEIRAKTIAMGGTHKEHSAYLYGTQELKKEAEKMYSGQIVLVGNPHIKAGDYAYLQDRVRGLSGTIKIRECEHYVDEQNGYITVITPGLWVEPSQFAWNTHLTVLTALGKFSSEVLSDLSVEHLLEDMATYQSIALVAGKHRTRYFSDMLVSGGSTAFFAYLGGRMAMRVARKVGLGKVTMGQVGKPIAWATNGVLNTFKAYGAKSLSVIQQSGKFKAIGSFVTTKVSNWKYFQKLGTVGKWLKGGRVASMAMSLGKNALLLARGIGTFIGASTPLGWLVTAIITVALSFVWSKVNKVRLTRQPISFIPLTYNYAPYVAGVDGFTNNTYLEALWQNVKQVWKTAVKAGQYYHLNHGSAKQAGQTVVGSNFTEGKVIQ